jgi:thiosulfate/3-mercaptopyruvate sulfurtransferase
MTVPGYASDRVLVDADWAKAHLDDPNVRFVEVDVDTTAYSQGHLPGAVGWDWTSQLSDGVRRDLASRADFSELLSRSGIGPATTIVLYGDNNNWFAAFAYWQLKLFGHDDVRIINGGRKYWLDHGLPITTDEPSYPETGYQLPEPDFALRAYRDDILPRLGDVELALVDVRSPAEYNGEIIAPPGMSETAQRPGRIPGAASIPWGQTVREDGTFKSPEELRALYGAKGVTPDKDVIAYCRIGERSSHSWFVLHELLGYQRVRNYDGSWTEWGSLIGVPIEKPVLVPAG